MTELVEVQPGDVVATAVNTTSRILATLLSTAAPTHNLTTLLSTVAPTHNLTNLLSTVAPVHNLTTLLSTVAPNHNLTTKMVTSISTMPTGGPVINTTTVNDATILTSTSKLPPTSDDMKVFSFDFIDSKKFQDRMEDFLAGREAAKTSTTTTVTPPIDMTLEDNLGLFIPVIVFGVFLMFIGLCVLWQVLHNRLNLKQKKGGIHSTFQRSQAGSDSSRCSTKSTATLKAPLTMLNLREFYPRLGRISESPEDRLKVGKMYDPNMLTPDSSFGSILSQLQHELANVVASNASMGISPYTPLPPPNYFPDISQSYPSLPVTAQAPFSPYHLAWMTPDPARPMHPDLYNMNPSSRPPNMGLAATPPFNNFNDPNGLDAQALRNLGKSPFHPNNNTPTNGSENDSGALPSNVYVNQISSLSLQPDLSSSLKESHSTSEPEMLHSTNQVFTPRLLAYNRSASVAGSGSATPSTECILSGPSNLGSWRYNRLYVGPHPSSVGPQSRLFANYGPADLHALQHNSSVSAMMGSRNTSTVHPVGDMMNGSCSLPDLPDLIGPTRGCPHYQADLAAYLQYELSRFSPAPPYEATANLSAQPFLLPMTSSTNVSTCGQMDSLETSVSDSTITGRISNNTSGYTAGPSHSTSVMGLTTGQMASLGVPSTHSSFLSTSMSSILPVNSGATHNTPNTSYASSSYSHRMTKEGDVNHNVTHGSQVLQSHHESSRDSQNQSGRQSHNTTTSHPAITSSDGDTGSTLTSLPYDEPLGVNQSHSVSHATASSTMDQTQHTTAPESISLQWDSLSVETDSGGAASMFATQGSQDNSNSSANNAISKVKKSVSQAAPSSSQASSSDDPSVTSQQTKSSGKGFDWDGFPFYTPSRNDPRRKTIAIQPGHTGPPPQRPMQRKPSFPILSNAQYWV